eukprot:s3381_g4.t1
MDPSCNEKIASIRKETEVLLQIQGHPNICECLGCFDAFRPGTSQAQYIMIVMELIEGGELASFIMDGQGLSEDIVKSIMRQTTAGLKFIHDRDVVHRDLKVENILVCGTQITPTTPVKVIDFGVAKSLKGTMARSCVGTTEIMAPEIVSAKLMLAPKGASMKKHGPYSFKAPQEASPGFGIVTQRPDGKGAMVNGIEPGGQAATFGIGDGWAISRINNVEVLEMPFVKDFNEIGAGTKAGVTAIAEILGSLNAPFNMEFVELPKREFNKAIDLWSLGVSLHVMLTGKKPFEAGNASEKLRTCSPFAPNEARARVNHNKPSKPETQLPRWQGSKTLPSKAGDLSAFEWRGIGLESLNPVNSGMPFNDHTYYSADPVRRLGDKPAEFLGLAASHLFKPSRRRTLTATSLTASTGLQPTGRALPPLVPVGLAPDQHWQQACCGTEHPLAQLPPLPPKLLQAAERLQSLGGGIVSWREEQMKRVRHLAESLQPVQVQWQQGLHPKDLFFNLDYSAGVRCVGRAAHSFVMPLKRARPTLTVDALLSQAKVRNPQLIASVRSSGDAELDRASLQKAQKELDSKAMLGPWEASNLPSWVAIVSRRFPIWEHHGSAGRWKCRNIDEMSESMVNATAQFGLGVQLEGFSADFSAAYRQVAISPAQYKFHGVVWWDCLRATVMIGVLTAPPFGARRAPANWGRLVLLLMTVAWHHFSLLVLDYVDDVNGVEPHFSAESARQTWMELVNLLGLTPDIDKCSSCASPCFDSLGVSWALNSPQALVQILPGRIAGLRRTFRQFLLLIGCALGMLPACEANLGLHWWQPLVALVALSCRPSSDGSMRSMIGGWSHEEAAMTLFLFYGEHFCTKDTEGVLVQGCASRLLLLTFPMHVSLKLKELQSGVGANGRKWLDESLAKWKMDVLRSLASLLSLSVAGARKKEDVEVELLRRKAAGKGLQWLEDAARKGGRKRLQKVLAEVKPEKLRDLAGEAEDDKKVERFAAELEELRTLVAETESFGGHEYACTLWSGTCSCTKGDTKDEKFVAELEELRTVVAKTGQEGLQQVLAGKDKETRRGLERATGLQDDKKEEKFAAKLEELRTVVAEKVREGLQKALADMTTHALCGLGRAAVPEVLQEAQAQLATMSTDGSSVTEKLSEEAQIVNGEFDQTLLKRCSPDAQDLVKGLLRMNPSERLTADQVLAHPFLQ